ncbi:YcaO-like family protein [Myceligenerans xiligouense]|uniref:Ribosomal protein S12 methylthiotransferase accessory factor n=1 Tax=Myceligenerans xiligouense TaxID=253184 RepID=A0A3N4YME8_9MICO|nr:YcaO-like family protein [Myceligenerans xiligouense]RPF20616.1 ribosomal protein S12 methylthiotransferase accessory factor [Myceligenerans xiligouense]
MSTQAAPLDVERLVDPMTGMIRRVKEVLRPDRAPYRYTSLTAEVSDARRLGDWPADRVSLGTTFGDPAGARIAAIAEAAERYCGNFIPDELDPREYRTGTADELRAAGLTVVGGDELPRWDRGQLDRPGFPYTGFADDTPTLWSRCVEQTAGGYDAGGREVWMPHSLIGLNWRRRRFTHLPRIHHLNYAGIATGQGSADAHDRGLLELTERDALEVWWHHGGPASGIDLDSVPGLAEDLAGTPLEVHVVRMPTELAPAMGALVHDPDTGVYAAGFSAATDPVRAVRKAVLEAVHTWIYTLGCVDADGWVFQAVDAGLMAPGLYLEHRADRRYLDSAGEQFRHVRDLGAHVQVWLDERVHPLAARFTEPELGTIPVTDVEPVTPGEVRRALLDAGHRIITRDLTTRDVAQTSLRVVRTFATGLVPNAPAAFRYLGMPRFADAARSRGWTPADPADPLALCPPPHM